MFAEVMQTACLERQGETNERACRVVLANEVAQAWSVHSHQEV
jgi:hypothetical protein